VPFPVYASVLSWNGKFLFCGGNNMEKCPFNKKDVNEAIQRLVEYFQSEEKDKDFFGLDDLGIIDMYVNK
jgi:hypothetical protein